MKDIIDLGNLVFDHLVKNYGEIPESRLLFLYGIKTGNTWFILGTDKMVTVENEGVTTNFDDPVISELQKKWVALITDYRSKLLQKELKAMRDEELSFKEGEVFQFWQNETPFREINFPF